MPIRAVRKEDHDAIWQILEPAIRAGDTYPLPRDMDKAEAIPHWTGPDREAFVAEKDGRIIGTYYLRANQAGGGAHVANCGYVTADDARGRGVARSMCEHSRARERGFRAMQFNFVISTKEQAIRLWESLGFITSVVSRSPMPGEMHAIIGPNGDAGENRQGIRYCAPQATTSPHAYGKCMGWAELGRVCGCPPSTKCTAEQAHPDAEKAACVGKDIDKMKQKAHEATPRDDGNSVAKHQ